MIVSMIISLYTSRVFLDVLGVEDYGIYNIVGGFVTMLAIFTNTIRSAAQRFITYSLGKGDFLKLKQTFSTILTLYLIISVAIFLVGESLGLLFLEDLLVIPENRIDAAYFVFHCSLVAFVIQLLLIPFNASIIAHERMNFFALISIAESALKLIIVYLLVISPFDSLKTYAVLLLSVNLLVLLLYILYCLRHFLETHPHFRIYKPIFKELFSYSIWVTIGSSSAVVKEQGVNIVINNFCGVAMNAAKGISMQVEHIINLFAVNIGTAISPQITKSYAAGDIQRAISLTMMMAKMQGVLLLYLCVPLITETEYILSVWLKEVPDHAVLFTKWVLLLCVARTLDGAVVPLELAVGKVKYVQILGGGTMLMNLPLSILVLWMGADPVSIVVVGIFIELTVLLIVSMLLKSYINFPALNFFLESVLSVILLAIIVLVSMYILTSFIPMGFLRLIVVCFVSTVMISIISYYCLMQKKEKDFVINVIKKYFKL